MPRRCAPAALRSMPPLGLASSETSLSPDFLSERARELNEGVRGFCEKALWFDERALELIEETLGHFREMAASVKCRTIRPRCSKMLCGKERGASPPRRAPAVLRSLPPLEASLGRRETSFLEKRRDELIPVASAWSSLRKMTAA